VRTPTVPASASPASVMIECDDRQIRRAGGMVLSVGRDLNHPD
jgi:hypothetical protein